jgi:hypothetical protein
VRASISGNSGAISPSSAESIVTAPTPIATMARLLGGGESRVADPKTAVSYARSVVGSQRDV